MTETHALTLRLHLNRHNVTIRFIKEERGLEMGAAKRELERQDAMYEIGVNLAVRAKVVRECKYHDGEYVHCGEEERAYKLASALYRDGDPSLLDFRSRKELTDTVKAAIDDAAWECARCEKWMRE